MGDTLEYTAEEAQQEESTFKTPAAIARRQLVREKLDFQPDDDVLSIGCGPGFEPAEIAEDIGQNGHVYAIDQSEAMLTLAKRRCSDTSNITLTRADVVDLRSQTMHLMRLSLFKSTSISRTLTQHLQNSLAFSDQEGEQ